MKKLLSLLLALTMLLPVLASAEAAPDIGVIGSADGPTSMMVSTMPINLFGDLKLPGVLGEQALAAGRRVVNTLKVTELSGIPLETEEQKKALADFINALTLVNSMQGNEETMKVQLSGKDVLTLGAALSGKDVYLNSELLGGTIVVAEDEAEGLVQRVLNLLVSLGVVTEEDAESAMNTMLLLASSIKESMAQSTQMETLLAEMQNLDYTALAKVMELATNEYEMVEVPVVPRTCDPALMGVKASFDNEEMQQVVLSIYQFLLDNPVLIEYLGMLTGVPTEKQIEEMWDANKALYESMGFAEEAFRAAVQATPTMESILAEAMEEIRTGKIIEGEYVITYYVDANGAPVYFTADLPMYIEEESLTEPAEGEAPQQKGKVLPISVTYTRQTLADGVDHVCNIAVDGETLSIDVQTAENGMKLTMDMISADGTVQKLLDLTTKTQPGATESDPDTLTAELNIYRGEEQPSVKFLLEGECISSDVRSSLTGKLTINDVATGITVVMSLNSDTTINAADSTEKTDIAVNMDSIYADGTSEKVLGLTITTHSGATESDPDTLNAWLSIYDGEERPEWKVQLDGECVFNDVRTYLAGKLTITEVATGISAALSLESDTAINGVDFAGKANVAMEMNVIDEANVRIAMESDYMTTDPVDSIMIGQVIRPAELDDNAFVDWFVDVLKSVNIWQANAMSALPTSVLTLLMTQAE